MASRQPLSSSVLCATLLAVTVLAVSPLTALAVNKRVNNPTGDPAPNITQGDPSVAGTSTKLMAVFEDTSGGDSSIGFARSTTSGGSWSDRGQIPQGLEDFLGDPEIVYNPLTQRFHVVTESCFPPANKCPPNVVSTPDFGSTWLPPVDIFTAIQTRDKEFGTNPHIAVDSNPDSPNRGRLYVTWTDFTFNPSASKLMVSTSDDDGTTWNGPIQISDPPTSFAENSKVAVGPNGAVTTIFLDYASTLGQYNLVSDTSPDGGVTWGTDRVIQANLQSTGTLKDCGNGPVPVLNGDIRSFAKPRLAVSPVDGNRYASWHAAGPNTNAPDVFVSRSTDGGSRWGDLLRFGGARDEFFPAIEVGQDGTVGVAYYSRRNDPANVNVDVYARFSRNEGVTFGTEVRVTNTSANVPELNPNYDTARTNCDSPLGIDAWFLGFRAYAIWGDSRDAGPAANNSVDPNIYSVQVPMTTTTSASVARSSATVTITGAVVPKVPSGKVTSTLYRREGSAFVKKMAKTDTLDAAGKYTVTFARPAAGSCQVISKFLGNADYLYSTVTKTFNC